MQSDTALRTQEVGSRQGTCASVIQCSAIKRCGVLDDARDLGTQRAQLAHKALEHAGQQTAVELRGAAVGTPLEDSLNQVVEQAQACALQDCRNCAVMRNPAKMNRNSQQGVAVARKVRKRPCPPSSLPCSLSTTSTAPATHRVKMCTTLASWSKLSSDLQLATSSASVE